MKRFFLVILFLSFFGFSSSVSAYDTCQLSPSTPLPCTYNGVDYKSLVYSKTLTSYYPPTFNSTYMFIFFNLEYHFLDDTGYYNYIWNNQNYSLYLPSPTVRSWATPYTPLIYGSTGGSFSFCGSTPVYGNYDSDYHYLGEGSTVDLQITRSPEVGGGVSDYPAGENILCGIDSYEICEASFPLNTEVTLDASPNEGYALAYWEVNSEVCASAVENQLTVTMGEVTDVKAVFKPLFDFPLSGYTSTTVPISAVMDHSLTGGFYTADGRNNEVEAFNGLIANGTQHYYGGGVYCYETEEEDPFPNLNYSGGSVICYDEHAGFDFAVANGTNVLAPFAGKLYWATADPVNGSPSTFGTFYIDHENGYTSWFLHCSGLTQSVLDQIQQKGYADVSKGDHIAESSNKGPEGTPYHLHFEVRKDGVDDEHVIDPYGWELWEE